MRKRMFYAFGWTCIFLGLPLLGVAALLHRFGFTEGSYTLAHNYIAVLAKLLLWVAGAKVTVEGRENFPAQFPVVFVSSHQGHFDSAVILAHFRVPLTFVASSNAAKFPIVSRWFAYGSAIYMERDNLRQNYQALKEAEQVLASGKSVVIYPEGIISGGPTMGEFKRGSFRLATDMDATIVPLAIDGSWQIMGENGDTIQPAHIVLRVLPPISTKGLSRAEKQAIPAQVYDLIAHNLKDIQSRRSSAGAA